MYFNHFLVPWRESGAEDAHDWRREEHPLSLAATPFYFLTMPSTVFLSTPTLCPTQQVDLKVQHGEHNHDACHCRRWPQAQPHPPVAARTLGRPRGKGSCHAGHRGGYHTEPPCHHLHLHLHHNIVLIPICWPAPLCGQQVPAGRGNSRGRARVSARTVAGCRLGSGGASSFTSFVPSGTFTHQRGLCHCQDLPG